MNIDLTFFKERRTAFILLFFVILAATAGSPLFGGGWIITHDGGCHLDRIAAISYEIQNKDFYPRWISAAFYGKGLPVLNYYSPAYYLTAGYLHSLGVSFAHAHGIICLALFFLGAWGMFLWTRRHYGEYGALIAASVYSFVPYHFVDVYVRGAISEFGALVLLPFLFYSIDLLLSSDRPVRAALLAATVTALLTLTHNLSVLMIAPCAAAYFVWRAYTVKASPGRVLTAGLSALGGAGLSAFYWLPVLYEVGDLAHFRESIVKTFSYADNFVYPTQWFSPLWGFGDSVAGPGDAMSFQIGYGLLFFLSLSVLAMLFDRNKARGFGVATLLLGLFGLFLTASASSWVYRIFTPLQLIEFPWRFLGPATFFLSASAGAAAGFAPVARLSRGPLILLFIACLLGVLLSEGQRSVKGRLTGDIDSYKQTAVETGNLGTPYEEGEYLPRWAARSVTLLKAAPLILPRDSAMRVDQFVRRGSRIHFVTDSERDANVIVTSFYFPGWKATIDRRDLPVGHGIEGFITLRIPPGRHTVRMWFGTTGPRRAGWLIAAASAFVMAVIAIMGETRRRAVVPSRQDKDRSGSG